MLPTPLGMKALGFYGLCWFAFTATPYTNLFFFLILFQSLLLILGLGLPHGYLRGVEVRFPSSIKGRKGEPLTFEIAWKAPDKARAVDLWGMELQPTSTQKKKKKKQRLASLGRGGERRMTTKVSLPTQERGVFHLTSLRLRTSYPLGLFRAQKTISDTLEYWILPNPIPQSMRMVSQNSLERGEEEPEQLLSDRGREMAGIREFRPGDDPTRVYWKKSAQRGVLVVREGIEPTAHKPELFILDETQEKEAFERQLEALAYWGQKQEREHRGLTLRCLSGDLRFGTRGKCWEEFDRFLAHAQPAPNPVTESTPQGNSHG